MIRSTANFFALISLYRPLYVFISNLIVLTPNSTRIHSCHSQNVTSSSTANAVLEAARDLKSPIIIHCSQGGSAYYAGKGLNNKNQEATIPGALAAAMHVRNVAASYGVPVVMHLDHWAHKLLEWFDGMLEADEKDFK